MATSKRSAAPKRNKYGAKKTTVDGIVFASKAEAARWVELSRLERAGEISNLVRQECFVLAPPVRYLGAKRTTPALRYFADFSYIDGRGQRVVEDCKGAPTPLYKAKRHLVLAIHGVEVKEIRR